MDRALIIVPPMQWEQSLDWFRDLSTSQLKRMWDDERYDVHCDQIHFVMNERGQGEYVAV